MSYHVSCLGCRLGSLLVKLESFQAETNPPPSQQHCQQHSPNGSTVAICESSYPHYQAQLPAESHQRRLSLSARVFRSLAATDVESVIIVRQFRFLELTLNSNFTTSVLTSPDDISLSSLKNCSSTTHYCYPTLPHIPLRNLYKLSLQVRREAG